MDTTSESHSQATSGSPDRHHIRLACQACQRKKIKCDRNFPCGQCNRSSLQCSPSTRKPRARHTGKRAIDSELRNRISKLENLVESLSGDAADQEDSPGAADADAEPDSASPNEPAAVGKYIGSPFWSSLTSEVQALREALEDEHPEDDDPTSPSTSSGPGGNAEYDLLVCPPGAIYVMPGALAEPTPEVSATLCNVFCNNVDRMFKAFHTPTLRDFIIRGQPYLGHDHSAPGTKALKAAVYFGAINTLSETQCQMTLGQSRGDLLNLYRRMADVALSQADLMNTTDLATLQAFTTYIAASRLTDTSRRVWTLAALVVQIARAMGLHHESVARSPFETELRRRLWHQIRFLDVYAALDRGTEQLIAIGSYDTPLPKNCNDSEFDQSSTSIPEHESGLTDISFSLLAYDATTYTHRLTTPESKPNGETWQQRLELAQKFNESIQEKYLKYCDPSDPFHRLMFAVGNSMMNTMLLRAVRPMQKHVSSIPPRVDSPYVLELAANSLKSSEAAASDPETQPWRWMMWVQWHALAIALAGLCSVRDTELANEAWRYVEQGYARSGRHVADARNGMLWRPIEKLYRKASAFRDHVETPASSISPPEQTPALQPAFGIPNTANLGVAYPVAAPQKIPGAMPIGGVPNGAMDMSLGDNSMSGFDLGNSDMSWMDFERIFEDMSDPVVGMSEVTLGDMQWPQHIPPEQNWPCNLHQNLM